jgi:hypothetical protein
MPRTRGQSRELDFHNWDNFHYRGEGQQMQSYKFLIHIALWNASFAIICIPTAGKLIDSRFSNARMRPPQSGFVVCRACSAARRCKSSTQPDGGEGLAMMQGLSPRGEV